jgi:hypothetical protein
MLSLVGYIPNIGQVLGDERYPKRVAGQQDDGAHLSGRNTDMELPDVAADCVLVEDCVAHRLRLCLLDVRPPDRCGRDAAADDAGQDDDGDDVGKRPVDL